MMWSQSEWVLVISIFYIFFRLKESYRKFEDLPLRLRSCKQTFVGTVRKYQKMQNMNPFDMLINVITDTTLYYFFSTLAQTFGGLMALLGMFYVYKVDSISRQINDFVKSVVDDLRFNGTIISDLKIRDELRGLKKTDQMTSYEQLKWDFGVEFNRLEHTQKATTIMWPIILNSLIVGMSILCIPFVPNINGRIGVIILICGILIAMCVGSLYLSTTFILHNSSKTDKHD